MRLYFNLILTFFLVSSNRKERLVYRNFCLNNFLSEKNNKLKNYNKIFLSRWLNIMICFDKNA